jgi:transcriptional regulator with XRE-family HTH domain
MRRSHGDKPEYATRIAQLRKSLNLKQIPFARRLSVDQGAVSKWENGKNCPEPSIFVKLAKLADGVEKRWFLEQVGIAEHGLTEQPRGHDKVTAIDLNLDRIESLGTDALHLIIAAANHELARRNRLPSAGRVASRRRA